MGKTESAPPPSVSSTHTRTTKPMLPLHAGSASSSQGSGLGLPDYFRRILHYRQMDFEYVFWQMWFLFVSPSKVYRSVKYHKQTKNQWARDDPAFVVVLMLFMAVASLAYSVAFQVPGFFNILRIMVGSILVDFLGSGVLMATGGWWLANKYLKDGSPNQCSVDQDVEWLYAFDVHVNAFVPPFLILYVLQYFLLPIFMRDSFLATLLANTTYMGAITYYHYIFFLGYNVLPFLQNQVVFLYPVIVLMVVYLLTLIFRWNICIFVMSLYFG